MSKSSAPRAYTLVELLIVILVLGITAALVVPRLSAASEPRSPESIEAEVRTLEAHLALFRDRHGRFPTRSELARPPAEPGRGSSFGVLVDEGYLSAAPINPQTEGDLIGEDWLYDEVTGRIWPVAVGVRLSAYPAADR